MRLVMLWTLNTRGNLFFAKLMAFLTPLWLKYQVVLQLELCDCELGSLLLREQNLGI